jgi:hypothetical protein
MLKLVSRSDVAYILLYLHGGKVYMPCELSFVGNRQMQMCVSL